MVKGLVFKVTRDIPPTHDPAYGVTPTTTRATAFDHTFDHEVNYGTIPSRNLLELSLTPLSS